MRVLVTRPAPKAHRTAQALEARGHTAIEAPLTTIEHYKPKLPARPVDAVIATSSHAFHGFGSPPPALAGVPVHCVGARTAEAARDHGFKLVGTAAADARALAAALVGLPPCTFLYLAGRDRNTMLEEALAATGHRVELSIVYAAVAVGRLPDAAREGFATHGIDAVLHYSQRHALLLWEFVEAAGFGAEVAKLRHVCISAEASQPLRGVCDDLRIAREPTEDSLFAALEHS